MTCSPWKWARRVGRLVRLARGDRERDRRVGTREEHLGLRPEVEPVHERHAQPVARLDREHGAGHGRRLARGACARTLYEMGASNRLGTDVQLGVEQPVLRAHALRLDEVVAARVLRAVLLHGHVRVDRRPAAVVGLHAERPVVHVGVRLGARVLLRRVLARRAARRRALRRAVRGGGEPGRRGPRAARRRGRDARVAVYVATVAPTTQPIATPSCSTAASLSGGRAADGEVEDSRRLPYDAISSSVARAAHFIWKTHHEMAHTHRIRPKFAIDYSNLSPQNLGRRDQALHSTLNEPLKSRFPQSLWKPAPPRPFPPQAMATTAMLKRLLDERPEREAAQARSARGGGEARGGGQPSEADA